MNVPDLAAYLDDPAFPDDLRTAVREAIDHHELPPNLAVAITALAKRVTSQRNDLAQALQELHDLADEIRRKREREAKLQHRLMYDAKTGLPNHNALEMELPALLDSLREEEAAGATVAIVNVEDSFLHLRRTLPKQVTEWLLYATAERLQELQRPGEPLYHTREAEFVLVMLQKPGDDVDERVSAVVDAAGGTFKFPDYTVTFQVRCGIARFPTDGMNRHNLMRKADIALSVARTRKAAYVRFDHSMEKSLVEKMDLQNNIIRALERQAIEEIDKQFDLQLQPIVSIAEADTGSCTYRLEGGEALIRWNHPKLGRLDPGRFIPVAEESGLIIPIGNWVLFHAAEILTRWEEPPLDKLTLSVNISPRQFRDEFLLDHLERIVTTKKLAPNRLRLEITESTVMEQPDEAASKLAAIAHMGILIAIDDFGTGYSSLSFLRQFGFQSLKLDKSFIDDFLMNKTSRRIVTAIVEMAQAIGVSVIAEGVESQVQAVSLASSGVHHMQGYLFGAPVDVDEFMGITDSYRGTLQL
ncbi:MAG: putative bifunctional diguanylate cyclase/phosphodiesterase [Alkalispirochaetaceae bacterium]